MLWSSATRNRPDREDIVPEEVQLFSFPQKKRMIDLPLEDLPWMKSKTRWCRTVIVLKLVFSS